MKVFAMEQGYKDTDGSKKWETELCEKNAQGIFDCFGLGNFSKKIEQRHRFF